MLLIKYYKNAQGTTRRHNQTSLVLYKQYHRFEPTTLQSRGTDLRDSLPKDFLQN